MHRQHHDLAKEDADDRLLRLLLLLFPPENLIDQPVDNLETVSGAGKEERQDAHPRKNPS